MLHQNVLSSEFPVGIAGGIDIPVCQNPIMAAEQGCGLRRQCPLDLGLRPDKEGSLSMLRGAALQQAVGILSGVKTSICRGHFPTNIIQDIINRFFVGIFPGDLPRFQVAYCQLRLIVEHLFKVGDMPALVYRVPVKSSPEMIMDPTHSHTIESSKNEAAQILVSFR